LLADGLYFRVDELFFALFFAAFLVAIALPPHAWKPWSAKQLHTAGLAVWRYDWFAKLSNLRATSSFSIAGFA
jgi:hypothetical protein